MRVHSKPTFDQSSYGVKLTSSRSTVKVPFGSLAAVNSDYTSRVIEVVETGELIGGRYVEEFEGELAKYLEVGHIVSVASGMDALTLSLLSLDLPAKSKILVANNAGGYASLAALNAGHIPLFCDVSTETYLVTLENIQNLNIVPNAIILTHLYGKMAEIERILIWANDLNIPIIEDCAQSIGAEHNGKKAGTFGILGCFSFYPTKNLGGIGDGGAISTNNSKIAKRIRELKQYGWSGRYQVQERHGMNSRLDAINAAVLSSKLLEVDKHNAVRREILRRYHDADISNQLFSKITIDKSHVAHLAVGTTEDPPKFIDYFQKRDIEVSRHYPFPDSELSGLNYNSSLYELPVSRKLCREVVSMPLYPQLSEIQIDHICATITEFSREER